MWPARWLGECLEAVSTVDLSSEAFPYLGVREGEVAGVPARLLRVGFVGEWGYEIHVPADAAAWVWDRLMEAGAALGIQPFGVEAQRILRLEKGHVIVGQDTDGLTHPLEAGMGWAVKMDKPFFVGQRSLAILAQKPLSRSLVGFSLPETHAGPIPKECHLVINDGEIAGRVTSVTHSPTLGQVIGLAYVTPSKPASAVPSTSASTAARWSGPPSLKSPFYDPQNRRQSPQPWGRGLHERVQRRAAKPGAPCSGSSSNAVWTQVHNMPAPLRFHDSAIEDRLKTELSICDVSCLPKMGIKGQEAFAWLAQAQIPVPERVFGYRSLADDSLVIRTGSQEAFLEDSVATNRIGELQHQLPPDPPGVYLVARQDASFATSWPQGQRCSA